MKKTFNVTPDGIPVECDALKSEMIDEISILNRSQARDLEIQALNAIDRNRGIRAAFHSAMNYPYS